MIEDYPKHLMEFERRFSSEAACRDSLARLRWPEGFCCPRCGHRRSWPIGNFRFQCANCDYQVSVTAGTIFQDSHKPLSLWFRAIWWITSQKTGASALGLQENLGLGSYRTAWTWLHKLRRAMVRPGRDRLSGRVEVDETYYGGHEDGALGRGAEKKTLIAIAVEERGAGLGRIRMKRVRDASAQSLQSFVTEAVEPGSIVHTDGWDGYTGLERKGYGHEVTVLKGRKEPAAELLPRVHLVASLLVRWLMGTHQGAVRREYLDYYLDEFTFRFNRRTSRYRGKLFYRLLQQAAGVDPVPYRQMVNHASD